MTTLPSGTDLFASFSDLPDPRTRSCPYPWDELMLVAICAVLSGADDWVGVVHWATLQLGWLKKYLPFAKGIASHDTYSRVFSLLDASRFESCFIGWMHGLCPNLRDQVVPVDGKSVRGSHDGLQRMAHLVSAWHTERGMVLGQIKTRAKSNEITAVPQLLDGMDIEGAIITIDAMGCQREVVQKIVDKQAHYIIGVKNNQPNLAQAIEMVFDAQDAKAQGSVNNQHTSVEKDHGRLETRCCTVMDYLQLGRATEPSWAGLQSVVRIQSTREVVNGKNKGNTSQDTRYYISSLTMSAEQFNAAVRAHWGIENSCHWVLDMTFDEDDCRIRVGDGAQNFAILRRIALNLLAKEKSGKTSMNIKRLKAGWSPDYLAKLLGLVPQ
jgi:predicted transposase YbfD/YdcC